MAGRGRARGRGGGGGVPPLPLRVIATRSQAGVAQDEAPVAVPPADTQAPTEAPRVRRTRGPTRFSVETTRRPGDPRMRVQLRNGKATCKNKSKFKTTVLGWIHQPSVLPQNVPNYGAIPDAMKEALFKRIVDCFEIVEAPPPASRASSSSAAEPTPSEAEPTPSVPDPTPSEVDPTHASSTASTTTPCMLRERPGDRPTACIPLSLGHRRAFDGWVRDKFRDHRYIICQKHYDPYQTDEERLANGPPTWPDDMWRWCVDYWGTPAFQATRARGKANKAQSFDIHTTGSESYQDKRYKMMQETGSEEIDEVEFYRQTHTRKDGTWVDVNSKLNWERMDDRRMTLEAEGHSGCSGVAMTDVLGHGTKGRERLQGRVEPKGRDRVLTSELRAYEERMLESDRRADARFREQEERIQELQRENQRRDEQKAQEIEAMKDQIAQLMQSLQNRQPP